MTDTTSAGNQSIWARFKQWLFETFATRQAKARHLVQEARRLLASADLTPINRAVKILDEVERTLPPVEESDLLVSKSSLLCGICASVEELLERTQGFPRESDLHTIEEGLKKARRLHEMFPDTVRIRSLQEDIERATFRAGGAQETVKQAERLMHAGNLDSLKEAIDRLHYVSDALSDIGRMISTGKDLLGRAAEVQYELHDLINIAKETEYLPESIKEYLEEAIHVWPESEVKLLLRRLEEWRTKSRRQEFAIFQAEEPTHSADLENVYLANLRLDRARQIDPKVEIGPVETDVLSVLDTIEAIQVRLGRIRRRPELLSRFALERAESDLLDGWSLLPDRVEVKRRLDGVYRHNTGRNELSIMLKSLGAQLTEFPREQLAESIEELSERYYVVDRILQGGQLLKEAEERSDSLRSTLHKMTSAMVLADLESAREQAELLLKQGIEEVDGEPVAELLSRIEAQINDLAAERVLRRVDQALEVLSETPDFAVEVLREATQMPAPDEVQSRARLALAQAKEAAKRRLEAASFVRSATELMQSEKYDQALGRLRQARQMDPHVHEVDTLLVEAEQKLTAQVVAQVGSLERRARVALQSADIESAERLTLEAIDLVEEVDLQSVKPEGDRLRRFLSEVTRRRTVPTLLLLQLDWHNTENAIQDKPRIFGRRAKLLTDRICDVLDLSSLPQQCNEQLIHVFLMDTGPVFEGLRMPSAIPMVFLQRYEYSADNLRILRRLLNTRLDHPYQIALLLLFGGESEIALEKKRVVEKMRTYSFDVVPTSYHDWETIANGPNPLLLFRRLVLSGVNLATVAPFVDTGPTTGTMFFGREDEIRDIIEHAADASYAIIGGRRVGKSSILLRLYLDRLPAADFYTFYHDCSSTPVFDTLLAASIRDWQPEPPPNAPATFGDLFQCSSTDKPLVLLLDEVDKLIPTERASGWPLFNALRTLVNSGRAQVVLSGERTLRDALQDATSPLFNFASEMMLGPLDFHAVEELITRPMKQLEIELEGKEETVRRIYDFTSGHPSVVQRLCRRLINRLNEQGARHITLDDVETVISDPKFQEEDFLNTYWERATPLEQIISLLMAQEAKPYRLQLVLDLLAAQDLQPEAEVVKAALDRLVDLRSILKRSQVGYEFAVEAFPLVLAHTTTAEDLLIVLKSQYLKNPMELAQ